MATADQRLQIVFNGEICNFLGLRAEMTQHGHIFRTQCDTGALLFAYRQWGEDMGAASSRYVFFRYLG